MSIFCFHLANQFDFVRAKASCDRVTRLVKFYPQAEKPHIITTMDVSPGVLKVSNSKGSEEIGDERNFSQTLKAQ